MQNVANTDPAPGKAGGKKSLKERAVSELAGLRSLSQPEQRRRMERLGGAAGIAGPPHKPRYIGRSYFNRPVCDRAPSPADRRRA